MQGWSFSWFEAYNICLFLLWVALWYFHPTFLATKYDFFICMVGLSPKLKHIAPSFVFSFFELKPVLAKPQLQKTNLGSLHFLLRFCRTNCHLHCHYYPIRLSGSKAQLTPLLKPGCISLYILCKPFANPCLVNKL